MSRDERRVASVPRGVWVALAVLVGAQLWLASTRDTLATGAEDLPPAPRAAALRLASFGEPEAAARLAMLYVQAFDQHAGNELPYQRLDYGKLAGWLRAILDTDPKSAYPLFIAARLYAEVPDPERSRIMLDLVYQAYLEDPNRRWPALAHATLIAKHGLKDLPLARQYAAAIDRLTTAPDVPLWARQMEIFILEDMDELQAAKIMLGGLLASGRIVDSGEARFLKGRLEQMEARLAGRAGKPDP